MLKRYMAVFITAIALVGVYFLFFYNSSKPNEEYNRSYQVLVNREEFVSEHDFIDIQIARSPKGEKYTYEFKFSYSNQRLENVKILLIDNTAEKETIKAFPSFGIIRSLNTNFDSEEVVNSNEANTIQGTYLIFNNVDKIEFVKIYISFNEEEHFIIKNLD